MSEDMKWSESVGEITKAMAAVQKAASYVKKGGHNEFDNYNYVTEPDLIVAVRDLMAENGLALFTSCGQATFDTESFVSKSGGNQNMATVCMEGLLTHTSGEWVKVYSIGQGMDRGDKAVYKASTGAKKYLLGKLFNLPTGDEPEGSGSGGSAKKKAPKAGDNPKTEDELEDYL